MSQSMLLQFKNPQFEGENQQENLIAIFLSPINLDEHARMKINTFRIDKGVWGASPPEAEENLKKSNKMEAIPYFLCFLARRPISPKL